MESLEIKDFRVRFRESDGKMFFTVSDLQSIPEWPEGPLLELIKGELYMVPSPTKAHQKLVAEIIFQIKSYLNENYIGEIFPGPFDVFLSEEDYVIPDVTFVLHANDKIVTSKNIQGAPDLIIEIVSTNRNRDFIEKRNLYEKYGIKEYIIVDPQNKVSYQYEIGEGNYQSPIEVAFEDDISLSTLQGFTLNLHNQS